MSRQQFLRQSLFQPFSVAAQAKNVIATIKNMDFTVVAQAANFRARLQPEQIDARFIAREKKHHAYAACSDHLQLGSQISRQFDA